MPDKKYLIEIPGMPDGSGIWDADKWERNKDSFMQDYPDANVFEIGEYDAKDALESDQIMLSFEGDEESSGIWDSAKWERNKDAFLQDYPDARVDRVRYVDYWGDAAERNRARREELSQPDAERDARLAAIGYFDDISGEKVFDVNDPMQAGLKPVSSAMKQNSVSGETEYLDPKVAEFYANDSAYTERLAEREMLDAEYEQNPQVIAQREYEAELAKYATNLENQIRSDMDADVDSGKVGRGMAGKRVSGKYGMSPYIPTKEEFAEVEKYEKYTTALKLLEKAKIARDVAGKGFGRAVIDWAKEGVMDASTQSDIEAYNEIGNILTRLQKEVGNLKSENITEEVFDKYLSKDEQALIKSFFEYNSAMADAQQDMSRAYKGGKIFAESIPFMLEFLATGGLYKSAGRVATRGLERALVSWISKSARNTAARTAKKVVTAATRDALFALAGTTARTLVTPGTYNRMAEASVEINQETGELNRVKNATIAAADMYVENLSEISGGLIGKGLGLLGKGAGKLIAKTPLSKIGEMVSDNRLMQSISGFMPKLEVLGFNGLPEEIGEEFIGNAIREVTGIQPGALKEMVADDNFGAMLIGFAPMTLLGAAGGAVNLAIVNAKAAQLGKDMRERFADRYSAEELDHMMGAMHEAQNAEEIQQALKPMALAIADSLEKGMITAEEASAELEMLYQYGGFVAQNNALLFGKKAQDKQLMDAKREEFTGQYGRFWQEDESETVQIATLNNGNTVFVTSTPAEDGMVATVDVLTGKKGFANTSDIATEEVEGEEVQSSNSMTMDAFLNGQIAMQRKTAEETRMTNERNAQIDALRSQITPGTKINLGTEGSPVFVFAKGTNKQGVVIVDETGMESTLGWEQAADAMGQPIIVETDQQKLDEEISARLQRMAERRMKRAVPSPTEQATIEAAEQEAEIVEQEQRHIPLNEDGTVNEAAFWTQDPEGYVKWNDEQNQDGGQDSLRQIAISKQKLIGMYSEVVAGQNTSNPTMRKAAEKEARIIADKIARLEALEQSYMNALEQEKIAVQQAAATPTASMDEAQLEQMDAQYQGILGKTRVQSERVRVMQEYLDKISEESFPVVVLTRANYAEKMKAEGCDESRIKIVERYVKLGKTIGGFTSNGKLFLMEEGLPNINEARITYVHERQHVLNTQNPKYTKAIVNAVNGNREQLIAWVKAFVGEGMEAYETLTEEGLADELICRCMERAYTNEDFSVDLQSHGIPSEVISIIKEIDNEQRSSTSLANARRRGRRNENADINIEGGIPEDGRNSEQVSGGVLGQEAARPSGSGDGGTQIGEGAEVISEEQLNAPNSGEAQQIAASDGEVIADTNGKGGVRFSIRTWREGGRDYLAAWLANDTTLTEDEKADILARMDEFYQNALLYSDTYVPFGTWSEAGVRYDNNGNPLMSVIKANGDYAMNLDFSLVCKKRRPLNRLLRTLINRNAFGSYTLKEREIAEINWILQEHGFEVACALCFVDSKRYRVTGVADVFASLYNRLVKALAPAGVQIDHFNYNNNPNVDKVENGLDTMADDQLNWDRFDMLLSAYKPGSVEHKVAQYLREHPEARKLVDATDFIEAEGFESVKENNPDLLKFYNMKKGTGGPKASFGDVQYLNDILKKEKSFDAEKAYAVGGVRLQSFSDFVPHMYFDYMQLFAELAAKKLPLHAYTKEVLFAKIFGLTGAKINMSLVPAVVENGIAPGLDAEGNYAWADPVTDAEGNVIQQGQSFPYDEAMAIQNAEGYSKNCGVIAVGISDEHIEKMLDDPNIPFIIPYHKSSLNAIVARMTNIDQYKDYTNVQNTRKASGSKLDKGTKDFNFNEYLHGLGESGTPQQAAQAYLDWCRENKFIPKFSQFAYHPNYYKLLQDFNTIDLTTGEYAPQGAVTMTFPTEESAFGNVESLIQQGLQEDAGLEEKMELEIDGIADQVLSRLEEISKEPKMSEKQQAKKMAELADERMARIQEKASGPIDLIEEARKVVEREGGVAFRVISQENYDMAERIISNLAGRPYFQRVEGEYELGKLASNYAELADIIMAIDANRNYTPVGTALLGFFAENPDMHFPLLFNDRAAGKETAKAFADELSKVDDPYALFFMKEAWRIHKGSLEQAGLGVKPSSTTKFNKAVDARAEEIKAAEVKGTAFNFKKQESSLDEIDAIFKQLNKDPELALLHDRVMSVARTLGVKVSFAGKRGSTAGESLGDKVSYDYKFFNSPAVSDQKKCNTITHELIHSITVYAIYLRSKAPSVLSDGMLEAVDILHDVYNQIARDPVFKGEYGVSDVYEMVAELSNAQFRDKLKEKNLFQRILDALKRLLGIDTVKEDSAYQVLSDTLNYIIDNYDQAAFDAYALYASKSKSYGRMMKIEEAPSFRITPEQDKAYMDAVEAGDMETAQRMVVEAARLAMPNTKVVDEDGNPRVVYHQTNAKIYVNRETGQNWDDLNWKEKMEWDERDDWEDYWEEQDFNTFSRINARTTNEFDGFFFAPKFDEYHEYGDRTIAAFVNITNPALREDYNIDSTQNDAGRKERIRLQEAGFDGVIRMDGEEVDEYIAFEPSQIKSADPVTYDNDGNVIPLSERFNPENSDIRFRVGIDNSKARDLFKDPETNQFFVDKNIDGFNRWLKEHSEDFVILYHGTGESIDVKNQGLLKTSKKRRRSYQSTSGYVYLSLYPSTARLFGEIAYPYDRSKVYAVTVKIKDLKPDTDQLANKRYYDEDLAQMGNTLAESLIYASGARVKRNILPYEISEDIRFRMSNENQAIFVSNAAKAVEGIKQEKATPEQWLKMIEKAGGLKAGEDKWMGLSDWLKASDKKTLTKAELLDFINENMIVIEEQHYGEIDEEEATKNTIARDFARGYSLEELQEMVDENAESASRYDDEAETEDFSLDEWLMERMVEEFGEDFSEHYMISDGYIEYIEPDWWDRDNDAETLEDEKGVRQIHSMRESYTTKGLRNNHEIALTIPTIESWGESDMVHFGDAGEGRAVAWIRFGETWEQRPSPQISRKVLVIDEIQSKRHQEGREKGYARGPKVSLAELKQQAQEFENRMIEKYNPKDIGLIPFASAMRGVWTAEEENTYGEIMSALGGAAMKNIGIPDAPFDKNWHELAMKRMLRYAAENGYDVIAWTKGDQQANRYDLSHDVKKISVYPSKDGSRTVNIHLFDRENDFKNLIVDSEGIVTFGEYKGRALRDVVGKETALKIMGATRSTEFAGDNLKVGGEGMRGFYDKMLPAFMNKYGKKWGVKVEDIDLPNLGRYGYTMHSVPVTEEMKASVMEGQVMFRVRGENESAEDFYQSELDAYKAKYVELGEIKAYPINQETADEFGYTLEELENMGGLHVDDENLIAIFVHEDATNGAVVENAIFHEDIHYLAEFYPYMNNLGGWIWENAEIFQPFVDLKTYIEAEYDEDSYHKEMLAYAVSNALSSGDTGFLESIIPGEYHNIVRQIEKEIGYDRRAEESNRGDGTKLSDTGDAVNYRVSEAEGLQEREESAEETRFRSTEITPEVRDEMNAIAATAIVNGNYMKAPNGKDTNLTAEQWAMVRTKGFKAWFGDWENDPENASKVVDENGEPKVVFHGGAWRPLLEEKGNAVFKLRGGLMGKGAYFTDKLSTAIEYARDKYGWEHDEEVSDEFLDDNGYVTEVFLNIRNEDNIREYYGETFYLATNHGQIKSAIANTGEFSEGEGDIRFSIRTKPAPKKTGKGYKVFYLKDGKLYPPMVANQGGVDTPVGVWLDAEEGTRAGESKTGRPQVKQGGKGTQGGSGKLAYRPGWHLGEIPYALQFNRKDESGEKTLFPADFVWAEVEYANDVDYQEEAMSYGYNANGKFQHSLAGLPKLPTDGSYRYRTNPNPETDPWIITGAMKVNRLLTPSEVDQMVIDAGREPQKRQSGAVTDEQIEALNESFDIRYRVNENPTDAQKEAGNYKMGHLNLDGYRITIENPKGSVRRGTDSKGNAWENTLNNDYGYIRGTEGVDGDHIDVYLSGNPSEGNVFVIDQVNPSTREFDEHKVMYGFNSAEEAREAYLANFSEGWNGLGTITEVTKDEFKKWVESSHRKTKPFSEYKSVKAIGAQSEGEEMEDDLLPSIGTPTDEVVASGLDLSPAQTATLAGNIFAALPEDSRKKITEGLNGNILGLQEAILQIPTSLASKEEWNEEDRQMADIVREKVQDVVDSMSGPTSRPLTSKEALWMLHRSDNPTLDLVTAAKNAIIARNLGFDPDSMRRKKETDDYIRFRNASNGAIDAATDMYNYEASLWTERLKESWLDMNQSVKNLQDAIASASGMPIEPWENIVYALNRLSSKSYAQKKKYLRDYLMPLWDTILDIVKHDHVSIEEIERYMMLKHALERNEVFAKRDAREFYRGMFDEVARKMKGQSHAEQVVALSEAKKALADIDAQIATASGAKLQRLKDERVNAQYKVDVADLVLRGDEKQNEDDLQAYYDAIDAELDPKYREFREKDYGGLTSMFVDTTDVKRSDYKSEEAYQQAVLAATTPRYDDVAAMESAAEREVSLFENKVYMYRALWDKVNAATKETLRHQYESGMLTIEQYEAVRDMFKFYVPLRGFADNTAEDMYSYYMNNSSNGFSMPVIGAKGRTTRAESPLGWIGNMAESAIQADNKNEAKMCLYYAVLRRPGQNLLSITETWFEYTGKKDANGKKIYAPAYPPATTKALNADELRQHMEDWEDDMKKKQASGNAFKGTQSVNLRGSVVFQEDKQEKEHIIRVKVAGKDYSILINGNPRAAQAINGLLNPEANVGPVGEWYGNIRRSLSSLLTSFSPLFWVANYQRDLLSSFMRTSENEGWGEAMKYLNNRRKAWRVASYIYKYESGELGDSYYENLYKEFAENGGITGYTALTTNKEYEKLLANYAKSVDKPILESVKSAWDKFMGFGEAIEQVSRFAAYITAREAGKSIEEAVNSAKEVSVNFNRKGSANPISLEELDKLRTKKGKELNAFMKGVVIILSAMPKVMKELYFFFNASVQALSSSLKLAMKSPGKAAAWAGAYFGLSIAMAMINYLLSGDDDEEYLDLPDYLRHSTLLIKVSDNYYIKWSLPQEMRPFYAWADVLVSKMMGKMPHKNVGMEMALAAAQWLPVNPFEAEDFLLSLVPDVASPFAEVIANKTSFGGKIYDDMSFKSEGYKSGIPAYRKATEKTGKVYVELSELLNDISGGDDAIKGKININPAIMEHLVEGYGGGIYDFAKMMVAFPGMLISEDPVEIKNVPFVNKVVMSVDETNMYSHTNDAFYHYKGVAENAQRVEKEYAESDNPERAEAYRQEEDWRVYLLYKQYESDFRAVKERLDEAVDKTEEDLLKQEQNTLREMFLNDIAKGELPEVTYEIREDVKRMEKEVKKIMKPVNDANKERLERRKAGDVDGMLKAIERRDSLKDTPEYRKAESINSDLKKIKEQINSLGSVVRGSQRDSVIGELQKNYDKLKEEFSEL